MATNHFPRAAPVAKKYAAILFDLDGKLGPEELSRIRCEVSNLSIL